MAIDGVPMFPNYNNRGQATWVSCEVDRCNAHSGKGDDYHYHGDPYGTKCLYSDSDYEGLTHPPVIGFALDGYHIHGRYIDISQDGTEIALDSCGGHSHTVEGVEDVYHYHPEVEEDLTTNTLDGVNEGSNFTYIAYRLAPTTCWRWDRFMEIHKLSKIPKNFTELSQTFQKGERGGGFQLLGERGGRAGQL